MAKVMAISNQKGGVGKTTTAINLAAGLSAAGKTVLLVDFDSQGNASQGLSAFFTEDQPTVYSVLMEGVPVQEAVVRSEANGFDILPANLALAGADLEMDKQGAGKEQLLSRALEPLRDQYDYILIDCPPSLGLLNTNALTAADTVLIPVQCEYYALEGITQLLITIRLVQHTSNPGLRIEGILMTMYDIRTRLSVEVAQEVRQTFGRLVYQTSIPRNVRLSEAPSRGLSIFQYDPRCTGAQKYQALTEEILERARQEDPMSKNTGLGKGLGAIFSGDVTRVLDDIQNGQQDERVQEQTRIPVSEIRPNPYQPRKVFDQPALEELSQSIRQHGVFTPVLVKKSVQGYDLIAGERRLRATRMAGLQEIPAIIVEMSDQEMMEVALLENIQREDLNVIEEAKAYQQMIRSLNYTQDQLAHRIGKSREHITNTLRLLRLPEDVQEYAVRKELSMGHIRALLSLKNEDQMRRIARMAVSQGLSVRKVEQLVRQENMKKPEKISPEDDMFVKDAAKKLEGFFQTGVRISGSSVSIHYENDEDLTRILDLLGLTEKEA